jgi:hypothetical protein
VQEFADPLTTRSLNDSGRHFHAANEASYPRPWRASSDACLRLEGHFHGPFAPGPNGTIDCPIYVIAFDSWIMRIRLRAAEFVCEPVRFERDEPRQKSKTHRTVRAWQSR